MPEQKELFGFSDMTPWAKKGIRKIITKERMEQIKKLLEKKDSRGAAAKLRDLGEKLEAFNRRISNKVQ